MTLKILDTAGPTKAPAERQNVLSEAAAEDGSAAVLPSIPLVNTSQCNFTARCWSNEMRPAQLKLILQAGGPLSFRYVNTSLTSLPGQLTGPRYTKIHVEECCRLTHAISKRDSHFEGGDREVEVVTFVKMGSRRPTRNLSWVWVS